MTLKFEKQTPCEASIGEGWHVLVQPLIDQAEAEGNRIVQIKEKFGGLRFYVDGAVSDDLQGKISDAEARSFEICELCGDPGSRHSGGFFGGWIKTLCEPHKRDREYQDSLRRR